MRRGYVHGYEAAESLRLHDQASTLEALLHHDTAFPAGSITGEKERKTYEMLLASPLRPSTILVGPYGSRSGR